MTILIILIMAESRREGMGNAPRRQADRSTRAHAQVHRKLLYGHQGIRHIVPHLREPACFMGPHGCRQIRRQPQIGERFTTLIFLDSATCYILLPFSGGGWGVVEGYRTAAAVFICSLQVACVKYKHEVCFTLLKYKHALPRRQMRPRSDAPINRGPFRKKC